MADQQPTSEPEETWEDIPGYDGRYQCSNQGRVRRQQWSGTMKTGKRRTYPARLMKQSPLKSGHMKTALTPLDGKVGKSDIRLVHRLVLETFVGPCPEGMECRHLNDNPADNRLSNLCWGTRTDNMFDRTRNRIDNNGTKHATHCARGHAFDDENTINYADGHRACRTCVNAAGRRRRATYRDANPIPERTQCKRGHDLVEPNLRIGQLPRKDCKACHRGYEWARNHHMTDSLQQITDSYYEKIMGHQK